MFFFHVWKFVLKYLIKKSLKWICQEIVDGGGLKFIHDILLNHRSEAELGRTIFTGRLSKFYFTPWFPKTNLNYKKILKQKICAQSWHSVSAL